MSLLSSLFSGVTGMSAYGNAMSIIGNNIANVNTSGFKAGRPIFGDILSQSLGASSQIGRGVELEKVDTLFQQGSFSTTENITDMAIDGSGFFEVKSPNGTFFSRAGNFHFDSGGYLVNPDGLKLQGSPIQNGNVTGSVVDIQLESLTGSPKMTGNGTNTGDGVQVSANLDSRSVTPTLPFDPTNASVTSNFSTSITVYDSLGNGHLMNAYFRKVDPSVVADGAAVPVNHDVNNWEFHITTDGKDLTGGAVGVQTEIGSGVLQFDSNGLLFRTGVEVLPKTAPATYTFPANSKAVFSLDFSGGATQAQQIGFNFGDPIYQGGAGGTVASATGVIDANSTGKAGITQYGATSAVSYQKQDGYTVGSLRNVSISQQGVITGIYTNGQTIDLYQIFLADFKSSSDLMKQGKNLFSQSKESGEPIIGPPGSSGKGTVVANSVEMSNVDLAAEFVNMITVQRGFTANTRVIATSDQMLTELVNLKR
jgi:flagellar hook protein FlgE